MKEAVAGELVGAGNNGGARLLHGKGKEEDTMLWGSYRRRTGGARGGDSSGMSNGGFDQAALVRRSGARTGEDGADRWARVYLKSNLNSKSDPSLI
jgi:hypothetical protein